MKRTLAVKSKTDPEINWAVTDHVIANFRAHAVSVSKKEMSASSPLLADGCPTQAIVAAFGLDERTVAGGRCGLAMALAVPYRLGRGGVGWSALFASSGSSNSWSIWSGWPGDRDGPC